MLIGIRSDIPAKQFFFFDFFLKPNYSHNKIQLILTLNFRLFFDVIIFFFDGIVRKFHINETFCNVKGSQVPNFSEAEL